MAINSPKPIPINAFVNAIDPGTACTAFLVSSGSAVWLTTCLHAFTGDDPNISTNHAFSVHESMRVVGRPVAISLFDGNQHRFNIVSNPQLGTMHDALTIKLRPPEVAQLRDFGAYDLGSIVPISVGDRVTVRGFPGLQTELMAPTTLKAKVIEDGDGNFKISKPSATGYSGGPVVTKNGLVGLVRGDTGKAPHYENGLAVALSKLATILFK